MRGVWAGNMLQGLVITLEAKAYICYLNIERMHQFPLHLVFPEMKLNTPKTWERHNKYLAQKLYFSRMIWQEEKKRNAQCLSIMFSHWLLFQRLQMRKSGKSHKRNSCTYHDLSKAKEGSMINSMDQVSFPVKLN